MVIPAAPGVLFPGGTHEQQVGVCWHRAAGADLPPQFILRGVVAWPSGPDCPDPTDPADATCTDNTAYSFYDLATYERLAQIALALDLSGSMLAAMPAGGTRLDEAKDKATLFTNLVETGNQLGVYGFATDNPANEVPALSVNYIGTDNSGQSATLSDVSEIAPMTAIDDPADKFAALLGIAFQGAHGCTPVGQGLLRARAGLAELAPPVGGSGTPGKAIVLFSDGLQNVPPFVNAVPAWNCSGEPAGVPISAEHTFGDAGIEIYSVYYGPEVGWAYDLMNEIKEQTGGDYIYGAATGLELAAAYYAIRGLVDDLIFFLEEGETSPAEPWPTFAVEFDAAAAREATVAVAWPWSAGETDLTVDYRRQGQEDWQSSEQLATPPNLAGANLPRAAHHVFRFAPGPDTTWEFRVRQLAPRSGATRFTAAVFSPVRDAQIQARLDDERFEVGQPLTIFAELTSAGHPLAGAAVEAVVELPARPFSTTLRRYADRLTATGGDPDSSRIPALAAQLRQLLAQETGSGELYPTRRVTVALADDGLGADARASDGTYSGRLAAGETEVAGPYEVTVTARAPLASGRTVERTARLSTVANVGPADPSRSDVRSTVSRPRDDGSRLVTVVVLPTDRFGNAAFPGSAHRIGVTAPGAVLYGGVVDGLDSTFTQTLVLPPGVTGTNVTVSVGGRPLPTERVGEAALPEASFHFGAAIPHGSFGTDADAGWTVGLDYAYRLGPHLAVRAEVGWSDFDLRFGGSRGLGNLNAYLQYRGAAGPWVPYFEAGVGYYDLEGDGSAGGFAAGLGAQYVLTRRWNLDLNLHGHRVGGRLDLDFTQVRAGVIYKF
jgi:opacity protein-like surface antigen